MRISCGVEVKTSSKLLFFECLQELPYASFPLLYILFCNHSGIFFVVFLKMRNTPPKEILMIGGNKEMVKHIFHTPFFVHLSNNQQHRDANHHKYFRQILFC